MLTGREGGPSPRLTCFHFNLTLSCKPVSEHPDERLRVQALGGPLRQVGGVEELFEQEVVAPLAFDVVVGHPPATAERGGDVPDRDLLRLLAREVLVGVEYLLCGLRQPREG